MTDSGALSLSYAVSRWNPAWAVPDVPVEYLRGLLAAWAARAPGDYRVFRNLGLRWIATQPRVGFDPDLALIPGGSKLTESVRTLRLWVPGHEVPNVAVEVVSPGHPYKDYVDTPERAAAAGIAELWVYDPELTGPSARGGPHLLQVWRRTSQGFERVHAGDGPAFSSELHAWLHPSKADGSGVAKLRLSSDTEGKSYWLTQLEEQTRRTEEQTRRAAALEAELERLRRERG
jgi:Uma2 family endonuclease